MDGRNDASSCKKPKRIRQQKFDPFQAAAECVRHVEERRRKRKPTAEQKEKKRLDNVYRAAVNQYSMHHKGLSSKRTREDLVFIEEGDGGVKYDKAVYLEEYDPVAKKMVKRRIHETMGEEGLRQAKRNANIKFKRDCGGTMPPPLQIPQTPPPPPPLLSSSLPTTLVNEPLPPPLQQFPGIYPIWSPLSPLRRTWTCSKCKEIFPSEENFARHPMCKEKPDIRIQELVLVYQQKKLDKEFLKVWKENGGKLPPDVIPTPPPPTSASDLLSKKPLEFTMVEFNNHRLSTFQEQTMC